MTAPETIPMEQRDYEPLLEAPEVAAILRLKVPTIYEYGRTREREMGTVRFGRRMLFRPEAIRQLIRRGGLRTP